MTSNSRIARLSPIPEESHIADEKIIPSDVEVLQADNQSICADQNMRENSDKRGRKTEAGVSNIISLANLAKYNEKMVKNDNFEIKFRQHNKEYLEQPEPKIKKIQQDDDEIPNEEIEQLTKSESETLHWGVNSVLIEDLICIFIVFVISLGVFGILIPRLIALIGLSTFIPILYMMFAF